MLTAVWSRAVTDSNPSREDPSPTRRLGNPVGTPVLLVRPPKASRDRSRHEHYSALLSELIVPGGCLSGWRDSGTVDCLHLPSPRSPAIGGRMVPSSE